MARLAVLLGALLLCSAVGDAQQFPITLPAHVIVDSCSGCGGSGGATIGAAVPATASAVAVKDNAGNLAYPSVDASGNLLVAVTGAGSGGTSSVDGAAYSAGTTAGTPLMGARDDAGTTACAEDKACIARLTSARALLVDLSATTANGTAIKVDGSAATQPVSGTVTANQGGTWTVQPGNTPNTTAWKVDGSAVTQPISGTVTATQATGSNLHIVCDSGCSSSTAPADEAAFTAATTSFSPIGGFFQTTATSNALTTGQMGAWQFTANRAGFVNLRNASGAELGVAAAPLQVSLANTAANATAVKVDGSAVTQPVSGTVTTSPPANASTNVAQLAGTTTDTNSGVKSAGTLRVVLATDQPALTNKLLVTPDSVALPANQSVNVSQVAGTTTDTNSGNKSAGTLRVVLATDQPQLTAKLLVTPDANSAVNVAQINGVTPLMGAGATGTGALRTNGVSESATGAAPPASASFVSGLGSGATGGFLTGIPVCDTFKAVSMTSATTTLMVTGVSGRHVRICSINLVTAIANNVVLISGTGATCGTGTGAIMGGTTAANGWNFAANGGITVGSGIGTVMQTAATGDSVCIITSAAGPLAGTIAYTIY